MTSRIISIEIHRGELKLINSRAILKKKKKKKIFNEIRERLAGSPQWWRREPHETSKMLSSLFLSLYLLNNIIIFYFLFGHNSSWTIFKKKKKKNNSWTPWHSLTKANSIISRKNRGERERERESERREKSAVFLFQDVIGFQISTSPEFRNSVHVRSRVLDKSEKQEREKIKTVRETAKWERRVFVFLKIRIRKFVLPEFST